MALWSVSPRSRTNPPHDHASQKSLLKAISDEHDRHESEVEKSFDTFKKATPEGDKEDERTRMERRPRKARPM